MVLCDRDGVTLTDDDDDGKVDSFVSKKEKCGTRKSGAGSDTNQNTYYICHQATYNILSLQPWLRNARSERND